MIHVFSNGRVRTKLPFCYYRYVDDMLIASNCDNKMQEVKDHLTKNFEMTDLGSPKKFLGFEIERDVPRTVMKLTQSNYCDNIGKVSYDRMQRASHTNGNKIQSN